MHSQRARHAPRASCGSAGRKLHEDPKKTSTGKVVLSTRTVALGSGACTTCMVRFSVSLSGSGCVGGCQSSNDVVTTNPTNQSTYHTGALSLLQRGERETDRETERETERERERERERARERERERERGGYHVQPRGTLYVCMYVQSHVMENPLIQDHG